jgi:hypothetical protein
MWEDRKMKATDCKCIKCGQQAVAFWTCIDPDIPSHPYCRRCLDDAKARMIIGFDEMLNKK